MESIEELKKELAHYQRLLGLAENDVSYKGYLAYVKIVRQQVEFLENFNIKSNIDGKKTETAIYERAESMWANLPKMVSQLNTLKLELKIEWDSEEGKTKKMPLSPQSIGKAI